MDPERWERLNTLFHSVAGLSGSEQGERLREECRGDPELYRDVLGMLAADQREDTILDGGVAPVARGLLAKPAFPYQEIGPYRIEGILGEGGMGTVFLGVRADLNAKAAIKVLRDAWISPARRGRFAAEQQMLAQLDHPNIARLLDAGTLPDGTPYFVMEYVDGVGLEKYCQAQARSIRQRVEIFRSVCEAVQFAHRHAFIHRDLKPSNILVRPDGEVKLLDFGIAKQLDLLQPAADTTRTGLHLMTPAYASPEQIRGEPPALHSDVYSLGVILYQVLTGRLPFDLSHRMPTEAASILAELDPVKPSLVVQRLEQLASHSALPRHCSTWADLDVLCLSAMHKDVQKRYGSVEALIRDIDHYLRGEPLEARPDTFRYRAAMFVRRHRSAVLLVTAAATTLAGMLAYFTVQLAAERNSALLEASRAQRIQALMLNLFQGGDKEAGPSSELLVTTLLDRGVQEANALAQDPAVQADLYRTLGEIYRKLGRLDQADAVLGLAWERTGSLPGANVRDLSGVLIARGLLRVDQAKLREAEKFVREGLDRVAQELPSGHPAIAAATDALGRVLEEKGEYEQARPVLEEAVRLRSAASAPPGDLAASLYELANVYFYVGRYKEAEALNLRVLDISRRIYGPRHPKVAEALVNLGAIQQDAGNYRDAEKFHRQALEITRLFYGERHFRTAANLTMVARALVYQKRPEEAVPMLEQAMSIQERVLGRNHPRVASALNELGNVAVARGRVEEAKAAFRRMGNIYRLVYPNGHYLTGTAVSNLGSAYLAGGDPVRAERQFVEALGIYGRTLPPDHLNIAIAKIKLGRALLRQRRYQDAEKQTAAGYAILGRQVNPSASWLQSARADLAAIYTSLNKPDKAAALLPPAPQNLK